MILGLTGGIASGKSTVSKIFAHIGVEVVDADVVAKEVSERQEVVEELVAAFGREILDEGVKNRKNIDRKKLREIIFSNRENVKKINAIIHPRVIETFEERRKSNLPNEIIIFDIPLLFEAKLEYLCDKIVVVSAGRDIQIKRVMARDGSTERVAENIINSQMGTEEKEAGADYIIRNERGLDELECEVKKLYEKIRKKLAG